MSTDRLTETKRLRERERYQQIDRTQYKTAGSETDFLLTFPGKVSTAFSKTNFKLSTIMYVLL